MKIKLYHSIVFILTWVTISCRVFPCGAQDQCDSFLQSLQLDTLVTRGKLDNGLTYYIRKNNYPVGKIAFF